MALSPTLTAAEPFVAFRLTRLRIRVVLFLQIPKRLIRQSLLIAQGIGKTFHSLLTR